MMPNRSRAPRAARLVLRFLGEVAVRCDERPVSLPQSRKTRALLAWLVLNPRPHRRDRLCDLLWDVADDPRGALRWSLSKLRPLVDQGRPRILADRHTVTFDPGGADIDIVAARAVLARGIEGASTADLLAAVGLYRGEFLEGLDLPDFQTFQAWCVAEREQCRGERATLLRALADRLEDTPHEALAVARDLVAVDPTDVHCHVRLIRLLAGCGRRLEAERQYEAAERLFGELGTDAVQDLRDALREAKMPAPPVSAALPPAPPSAPLPPPVRARAGRQAERARLLALVDQVAAGREARGVLVSGEPGLGKTHLLTELAEAVLARGGSVLEGCAFEAERNRPYGPWVDALRRLPRSTLGETLAGQLSPLLEGGGGTGGQPGMLGPDPGRERIFGAVVDLVAARAHSAPPVLVLLDDMQWCDESSVEMLHYVVRLSRHRPLLLALAARAGELPDNDPVLRLVRGLRRDGVLEEMKLDPLSRDDVAVLVSALAPRVDSDRVYQGSAGNPLFAIELARAQPPPDAELPATVSEVVRDRVHRLPHEAAEVLRWGSVLGQSFTVERLAASVSLPLTALMDALETLERHALLSPAGGDGHYGFVHEVVRQSVYQDVSGPRRRLMHRRVAQALEASGQADESAAELAHHAALGGDDSLAAASLVAAGERCLRIFAGAEADALARRGIPIAERLAGPERVQRLLELTRLTIYARRRQDMADATAAIDALVAEALDHGRVDMARLGFQLLSQLYWEGGDWTEAARESLRAEQVSRGADPAMRVLALGESARCLAMLERDLARADALTREASAMAARLGVRSPAVADAAGLMLLHAGKLDEAAEQFELARSVARIERDRLDEFYALEHRTMVEIERQAWTEAGAFASELVGLGDRLREGSEAPYARVLAALCARAGRHGDGGGPDRDHLDAALGRLRDADAKQRLAYALNRAARAALVASRNDEARSRAEEALAVARAVDRPAECAVALTLLVDAAPDLDSAMGWRDELRRIPLPGLPLRVRRDAEHALARCQARS
jgi:DNA-binding SARP family transcriptional activator